MKKEIKDRWVAALRGGKYKQGKHVLKTDSGEFCCLGVLCDLHRKEVNPNIRFRKNKKTNNTMYLGKFGLLPKEVIKWAGLDGMFGGSNPEVYIEGEFNVLSYHNDDLDRNFNQIANGIEASL